MEQNPPSSSFIGFYSPVLDLHLLFFGSLIYFDRWQDSLDEWSARRKASTCTGQHNTERRGQTSMPWAGFKRAIQCTSDQGRRLRQRGHRIGDRILHDKVILAQLIKKFPAFYGTLKFITLFTRARHWSLLWSSWIQSTPSHPVSLLSFHYLRVNVNNNSRLTFASEYKSKQHSNCRLHGMMNWLCPSSSFHCKAWGKLWVTQWVYIIYHSVFRSPMWPLFR
jgi:hypothetical protein